MENMQTNPEILAEPAVVVLLSGGMDSTTLLHAVCRTPGIDTVYALSFAYGQKHSRELEMAAWQARAAGVARHETIDMSFFAGLTRGGSALTDPAIAVPALDSLAEDQLRQPPTYVPNRNMILLSLAAAWTESLGASSVYYGAQAQDRYGYWDCTTEFIKRLNHVFSLNRGRGVTIRAPFAIMPKSDVVREGLRLGVDYARTWSCYRGGEHPCRVCPTCVERQRAFAAAGVEDPLLKAEI
jgi:7-cyano-7-deazaguanine synthase